MPGGGGKLLINQFTAWCPFLGCMQPRQRLNAVHRIEYLYDKVGSPLHPPFPMLLALTNRHL